MGMARQRPAVVGVCRAVQCAVGQAQAGRLAGLWRGGPRDLVWPV